MPDGRAFLRSVMLQFIRVLGQPFIRATKRVDIDSLLLIRPDHLGDLLFTTPALSRLRHALPATRIAYLVGPWALPAVARNSNIDELLLCPFPWFDGQASRPGQGYSLLFRQAQELRRRRFDAAINLRFDFWWGAALAYLAGIPWRLGYATSPALVFLRPGISYAHGAHEVTQNLRLVDRFLDAIGGSALGAGTSSVEGLEFAIDADDHAFASKLLEDRGIPQDRRLLVIHPGTRGAAKRWLPERFAAVAKVLAERHAMAVVITGNAEERPLAESIATALDAPCTIAAGITSLGQLAALIARSSLIIGVDSGPLHLATALVRPSVHLYGPSDHVAFAPYGDPARHAVVRAGLDCSPCHRLDWPETEMLAHACMSAISVEQVLRAAESVMADANGGFVL